MALARSGRSDGGGGSGRSDSSTRNRNSGNRRGADVANPVVIKGAVPVLVMPFDEDGAIDEDSLHREIDFCLEAGAQAICFGMGSESSTLTDDERRRVWTLAARHLNGAVPLIA